MAIAFDTAVASVGYFSAAPGEVMQIPITIADNPNRILCVMVKSSVDNVHGTPRWDVGGTEYGLSGGTGGYHIDNGASEDCRFYYLLNPVIGSGNIEVPEASANGQAFVGISVYYNVEQVAPDSSTFQFDSGTATTDWTLSNTISKTNSWLIGNVYTYENRTYTTTTGTERVDFLEPVLTTDSMCISDNGPLSTGSKTIVGTISSAADWNGVSIVLTSDEQQILARPIYFK